MFLDGRHQTDVQRNSLPILAQSIIADCSGGPILTKSTQWAESRTDPAPQSSPPRVSMRPLMTVSMRHLFPTASFVGCADLRVRDVYCSSAEVVPGAMFAALPGSVRHGREFVSEAIQRGATSLLLDRPSNDLPTAQALVAESVNQGLRATLKNRSKELLDAAAVSGPPML